MTLVQLKRPVKMNGGVCQPGMIVEVPDHRAKVLMRDGIAAPAPAPPVEKAKRHADDKAARKAKADAPADKPKADKPKG